MQDFPLVSVTTCSYNNSAFIIDTLNSIRNQTYPNFELIIVDDCSTDNSVALIEEWLKSYTGKYKFVKNEQNLTGSAPYNIALNMASGKYYSVVDTDDVLMPEKIEKQVSILDAADVSVAAVFSDALLIDINNELLEGTFIARHREFAAVPSGNIYHELLQGNFIPLMSLLIRRDIFSEVGGYDESLIYGDFDLWLRIAARYQFVFSDYVSCKYRIRPGSLTKTIRNWEYSNLRIFKKHIDAPLPMKWLYDIAWKAYLNDDIDSMPLVGTIGYHKRDRVLIANYLLWSLGISEEHGGIIITAVHQHIARGLSGVIFNSKDTEVNVFLSEIAHSVSASLLNEIVLKGYKENNHRTKVLLEALAARKNEPYLLTMLLLWNLGISYENSYQLLLQTREKQTEISTPQKSKHGDLITTLLLNEIAENLPSDLLNAAVADAYFEQNQAIKPLIIELSIKTGKRLYNAIRLLWQYNIPSIIGRQILTDVQANINIGQSDLISDINASDDSVFTNEIAPVISAQNLLRIAEDAYLNDNSEVISILRKIADKSHNICLQTYCAFSGLKIPVSPGKQTLDVITKHVGNKQNNKLLKVFSSDLEFFTSEIQPLIPNDDFKALSASLYFADNTVLLPAIGSAYLKNTDRYLKAVLALWKYRVNNHTGEIILKRIDDYCRQKRNKYYIDLCIYKDIYNAIKTKNVS